MSAENTPEIVAKAQALGAIGFIGQHADAHAFSKAVAGIFVGIVVPVEDDLAAPMARAVPHTASLSRRLSWA